MIIRWLMFITVLSTTCLQGQTHDLWIAGGLRSEGLRDIGYSPLRFDGIGISAAVGYQKSSDKKETIWLLNYSLNQTSNAFDRGLTANTAGLLNVNLYKRDQRNFSWGWSNNNGLQHRSISGFDNFNGRTDVFTSFGPASGYNNKFTAYSQSFTLNVVSHLQLIGFYLPSGYVSSLPSGFGYEPNGAIKGFWESIYLFIPGKTFNAGFWPKLEWHLSNGNSMSVNYIYEYTWLSGAQPHYRSTGMWLFNFSMRLK